MGSHNCQALIIVSLKCADNIILTLNDIYKLAVTCKDSYNTSHSSNY